MGLREPRRGVEEDCHIDKKRLALDTITSALTQHIKQLPRAESCVETMGTYYKTAVRSTHDRQALGVAFDASLKKLHVSVRFCGCELS